MRAGCGLDGRKTFDIKSDQHLFNIVLYILFKLFIWMDKKPRL